MYYGLQAVISLFREQSLKDNDAMKKLYFLGLFFLVNIYISLCQDNSPIVISIKDSRYVEDYKIPVDIFTRKFKEVLQNDNYLIDENSGNTKLNMIEIDISYLNFYESSAKTLFGKGIIQLKLICPSNYSLNEDFSVSVDIPFTQIKLKYYENEEYSDRFANMEEDVVKQLSERGLDKINSKLTLMQNEYNTSPPSYNYAENPSGENHQTDVQTNNSSKVTIKPDVDKNIPQSNTLNENAYALIIGNEDYSSYQTGLEKEVNVAFAANDARIFKEYAINTLGIPEKQTKLIINGTAVQISQGLAWINNLASLGKGEATIYFYYSGHGLPDEKTHEGYIIPVDVSARNLEYAIKLSDVYSKLTEHPTKKSIAFIDACFSGGARNEGLLAVKAVKVKPKDEKISGNLVVMSSSSGEESSSVFNDKQHGYFTYFLLKKLQDSKADIELNDLFDYIKTSVQKEAALESIIQTPQMLVSPEIIEQYKNWTVK